jgi:hypothetical protein
MTPIVVPFVLAHQKAPEFFDCVKRYEAIAHPMFPGMYCLVSDYKITLRLRDCAILLLKVEGFYQDDGT